MTNEMYLFPLLRVNSQGDYLAIYGDQADQCGFVSLAIVYDGAVSAHATFVSFVKQMKDAYSSPDDKMKEGSSTGFGDDAFFVNSTGLRAYFWRTGNAVLGLAPGIGCPESDVQELLAKMQAHTKLR